jgi:hypothetical protein
MKFAAAVIAAVLGLMVLNGAVEYVASASWFGPIAAMFLISSIVGICVGTALRLLDGPR